MYMFGLYGYSLPHSATSQWNNSGSYVARADLQPGDLVLFCDPSRSNGKVTHLAIAVNSVPIILQGNQIHQAAGIYLGDDVAIGGGDAAHVYAVIG